MPDPQRQPRRQVVAHMSSLLRLLGENPEGMQVRYGVDRRHVEKFRRDNWGNTSREELQILMSLAHQRGMEFLTLEIDEVWRTFADGTAVSFLSKKRGTVREEDLTAMGCLIKEGIQIDVAQEGTFLSSMRTRNCVLFGSPKNNKDCEDALRAFFGATADVPPPFKFIWADWQVRGKQSLFCDQASTDADVGLRVTVANEGERSDILLRAQLSGQPADLKYGWDFGVFVMCRNPIGGNGTCTTVVMCGLSGFATQEVARELSQGLLFLHPREIADGKPIWRILCCPWKREGTSIRAHSPGRRWLDPADAEGVRKMASESQTGPPGGSKREKRRR